MKSLLPQVRFERIPEPGLGSCSVHGPKMMASATVRWQSGSANLLPSAKRPSSGAFLNADLAAHLSKSFVVYFYRCLLTQGFDLPY